MRYYGYCSLYSLYSHYSRPLPGRAALRLLALVSGFALAAAVAASVAVAQQGDAGFSAPDQAHELLAPKILGAHFEMDEESVGWFSDWLLPRHWAFRFACTEGGRVDTLRVVLSHEVDESTLERNGKQFLVRTRSGRRLEPSCARVPEGVGEDEDRTLLLYGELGNANDPPYSVIVARELLSEPDENGVVHDFAGLRALQPGEATDGPKLVFAERVSEEELELSKRPGEEHCPRLETRQAIRLTWSGAVVPSNFDLDAEAYLSRFHVVLQKSGDSTEIVSPFYIGDHEDNDNNSELCLDRDEEVLRVEVDAGAVYGRSGAASPRSRTPVFFVEARPAY